MKRYRLTPEARDDLRDIRDWIVADRPNQAAAIVADLNDLFALLGRSPLIGLDRGELQTGVRSFRRGNYLAFYRIEARFVVILRIVHGRRDHPHLRCLMGRGVVPPPAAVVLNDLQSTVASGAPTG